MEFKILGPLEVIHNGQPLELGSPQQRALLALLVLNVGRVVSTDRILEELWGDQALGKEQTLWVYVSRLRSILEPERSNHDDHQVLVTRDHGYLLNVDATAIDSHVFEQEVATSRQMVRANPREASKSLSDALALWRGLPLDGLGDYFSANVEAVRLTEIRASALRDRVEADLRRG